MIAYSIATLRSLDARKIDDRAASIRAHLGREVPDDEEIPLTVWAEVTPDLDDLIWAVEHHPARGRILNDFGCDCAERVLPIWLAAHPDDDRPAAAIRVGRDPNATQDQRAAAGDAAWAAARDAARQWQRTRLLELVGEVSS